MKVSFYGRYALRSLRRNGQRTVLAAVCVAFGVMSLAALWLLSSIVRDAVIVEPRVAMGGDARLFANDADTTPITDTLRVLRADGVIDQTVVVSEQRGLVLKPANAPVYILDRALGVDPQTYPLLGTLALRDGRSLADTLQQPGDMVVSRDVARNAGVAVGNAVTIGSQGGGVPARLRVVGIADHMPDRTGATAIYTMATAQQIAGHRLVVNSALVTWGPHGAALQTAQCALDGTLPGFAHTATERGLCSDAWQFQPAATVAQNNERVVRVFDRMLKGAGLLGLLVGGIGVANTLHVLLARRMGEIAMLKTLGYRRRNIVLLIGIETALLGVVGSVAGVVAAIALSYPLLALLGNTGGSLMATWHVDPLALLGGACAGIVTAIIFGVAASVRASAVRPAALLRNQLDPPRSTRAATLALWLVLGLVFALLSSAVLGSLLAGASVVALALGGLIVVGGALGGALALVVRVPLRARSVVALAQHNLRRQGLRSIFALIALWAGVFAIGFAVAAVLSGRDRVAGRAIDLGGANVVVYARADAIARVEQQLAHAGVAHVRAQVTAPADVRRADGTPLPTTQIGGRTALGSDLQIEQGAAWGTQAGVYVGADLIRNTEPPLAIGDQIAVVGTNGSRTLPVVGVFADTGPQNYVLGATQPALLTTDAAVRALGGEHTAAEVIGQAAPDHLRSLGTALSAALPDALVLTRADFNDSTTRAITNLFLFVIAIAALALLAGAVLIANAVGLALVERRRELGILKAVGYSSGHVLRTLLIEHALLGVLGGAAGIAGVFAALAVINRQEAAARLALDPFPAFVIGAVAVVLAVGSALLVARQPVHVRPLAVLRKE